MTAKSLFVTSRASLLNKFASGVAADFNADFRQDTHRSDMVPFSLFLTENLEMGFSDDLSFVVSGIFFNRKGIAWLVFVGQWRYIDFKNTVTVTEFYDCALISC